jgi:prepilin-type N-terminal cleavage/methylation domain-containing protein
MKNKGFTLIELMIVVAIIAILAAAALPAFGQQIKKAKDGKAIDLLGKMRSQFGMLQADLEGYPVSEGDALSAVSDGMSTQAEVKAAIDSTKSVKVTGINGYKKMTVAQAGDKKIAAGTPAAGVSWEYKVDGTLGTWEASYESALDTKGTDWSTY